MNGCDTHWALSEHESIRTRGDASTVFGSDMHLMVLLRVRNEELILQDTLAHLAGFADLIAVYDDASTDGTLNILRSHPKVALIIENRRWLEKMEDRLLSETRHRGLVLQEARKRWNFRWCMCCDADERYIGPIRTFVSEPDMSELPDAVRISLFDAYMTEKDWKPYRAGTPLMGFRKYFGPERRDILMLWKNSESVSFAGLDSREPSVPGSHERRFYCQHYGKSISIDQWEATCEYYVKHFPYDPYGRKWSARRGKAVHSQSDFGRPLYPWGETLFLNAVVDF